MIYRVMMTMVLAMTTVFPVWAALSKPATHSWQSSWKQDPDRVWVGKEFWAKLLQDWRISDGRLACTGSGINRNLHLLNRQITLESELHLFF